MPSIVINEEQQQQIGKLLLCQRIKCIAGSSNCRLNVSVRVCSGDEGGLKLAGRQVDTLRQHPVEKFSIEMSIGFTGSIIVYYRVFAEEKGEH